MRRFTVLTAVAALAASLAGFSQPSFAGDVHFHTSDTPSGYGFGFPSHASPFSPNPSNEHPVAFSIGR